MNRYFVITKPRQRLNEPIIPPAVTWVVAGSVEAALNMVKVPPDSRVFIVDERDTRRFDLVAYEGGQRA